MSENQLEELLKELNENPKSPKFLFSEISDNVFFGKIWHNLPWESENQKYGNNFYFIYEKDYGYIGVIEAGLSDLHVFLVTKFRGKGIISSSLGESILPHMFWYHAVDQLRITIDEAFHGSKFKKVENSALLAGFKNKRSICDRLFEYYADKLDYQEYVFLGAKRKLSHHEEEFNFLHKRINSINAQLQYMKERFEINFGENEELILNIKEDVRYFEHEYDKKIRSLL